MDRLDGLISSVVCIDLALECRRPDQPLSPSLRSWSDSDSLERPEDVELDDLTGRVAMTDPRPIFMVSIVCDPSLFSSVGSFLEPVLDAPKSLLNWCQGAKLPS